MLGRVRNFLLEATGKRRRELERKRELLRIMPRSPCMAIHFRKDGSFDEERWSKTVARWQTLRAELEADVARGEADVSGPDRMS